MDLYCNICGESWDMCSLNEDMSPEEKLSFIKGEGCPCCKGKRPKDMNERTAERIKAQAILTEIMGDDIDGIAASMEDWF